MSTFAEEMTAVATKLIFDFGRKAKLYWQSGEVDPSTGTIPTAEQSQAVMVSPPVGKRHEVNTPATSRNATEKRYMSAEGLSVEPAEGMRLEIGAVGLVPAVSLRIVAVELYEAQGRQIAYALELAA